MAKPSGRASTAFRDALAGKRHPEKQKVNNSMSSFGNQTGALVVGGDHPGLGVARSLGRRGIPVVVADDQYSVSPFSRYVSRTIRVKDLLDERKTVDALLDIGHRLGLRDWVLFPTRDETVAAIARNRAELAPYFRVTTPEWQTAKWACNKKNTYELAGRLGIPCPQTFNPRTPEDLSALDSRLPLALKPAVKENFFYATGAKAWRVNTPRELRDFFVRASRQIRPEEILLQEIIPGDGSRQYSYCAFMKNGEARGSLVARRLRQHPREFGRAATYVETLEMPAVEELSLRFLNAIGYYGLVEVEFKRDPRDNRYKLLDVNARTWGFQCLGVPAGVDFAYLLYADQLGLPVPGCRAKPGVGWLRLVTDVPTALADLADGRLSPGDYARSLRRTGTESVFSSRDPLPSLAELLLLPYTVFKRGF